MNRFKIFSLVTLLSLHGHIFGIAYKEVAALMLYVLTNNQSLGINTTALQPQPIFFSLEPELRNCLRRSVALPPWYKQNFVMQPHHPNVIVTETARVLASKELLPSTLDQSLQEIVHNTVFPDVQYAQEGHTEHNTVVSSLTTSLAQAVKNCQISAKLYQQQQAKKKKHKP